MDEITLLSWWTVDNNHISFNRSSYHNCMIFKGGTSVSSPLAIQDMPHVVLCNGLEHPAKMEEKLSHALHCQLHCQKIPVSVLASFYQCQLGCWWCLQGFCMPFRYLVSWFWNRTPFCCFQRR